MLSFANNTAAEPASFLAAAVHVTKTEAFRWQALQMSPNTEPWSKALRGILSQRTFCHVQFLEWAFSCWHVPRQSQQRN